jgi:lipopolysaccharide transport system permease protein
VNGWASLEREGWTVRRPRPAFALLELGRVVRHRELLFFLFWRDLKVKYRQMVLGVAWTVLQPVTQMIVFSVLFGHFGKLPSEPGVPYAVMVFVGLLPWQYFASSLVRSTASLVADQALLKRVALPRVIMPLAALLPALVEFVPSFAILLGLMAWLHVPLRWTALLVPAFLLLTMASTLAVGLWFSALNVRYRDVQYITPFLLQLWLFVTPVAYSAKIVPAGPWRLLYELNPMAVVVTGMRWALLGSDPPGVVHLLSLVVIATVLTGGLWYFRRTESTFADIV